MKLTQYLTEEEVQEYRAIKDSTYYQDIERKDEILHKAEESFFLHFKGDKNLLLREAYEYLKTQDKAIYRDYIRTTKEYAESVGGYLEQKVTNLPVTAQRVETDENGEETIVEDLGISDYIEVSIKTFIVIPKDSYNGYVQYLRADINLFYNAIDYYEKKGHYGFNEELRRKLDELIERQAQTQYKKPKTRATRESIQNKPVRYDRQLQPFPRGKGMTEASKLFSIADMEQYARRKTKQSKGKVNIIPIDGENGGFLYQGTDYQFSIQGINFSEPGRKVFDLIMGQIAKVYKDKQLIATDFEFPFSELVDQGYYEDRKTALKMFRQGSVEVTKMKVTGMADGNVGIDGGITPIPDVFREASTDKIKVSLSNNLDWYKFLGRYTARPVWTPRLNKTGMQLVNYVSYLAEYPAQKRAISEKGYFTLSYEALMIDLGLPDPTQTIKIKEKIIDPINEAIDSINKLARKNGTGFSISRAKYDEKATARQNLSKAEIRVHFTKDYIAETGLLKQGAKNKQAKSQKQ